VDNFGFAFFLQRGAEIKLFYTFALFLRVFTALMSYYILESIQVTLLTDNNLSENPIGSSNSVEVSPFLNSWFF
jgi:hypothetical protein